jgi:hypothetical protein
MGEAYRTIGNGKARGKQTIKKKKKVTVGRCIKMDLGGQWCGIDWIVLAQDRDQWRAFVSAVLNLPLS